MLLPSYVVTFVSICSECNLLSQCCNSYEYCVSCCLNPALVTPYEIFHFILSFPFLGHHLIEQSLGLCIFFLNLIEQTSKEQVLKMKVAKPATASMFLSIFLHSYFVWSLCKLCLGLLINLSRRMTYFIHVCPDDQYAFRYMTDFACIFLHDLHVSDEFCCMYNFSKKHKQ